jgi:hypothetical protein
LATNHLLTLCFTPERLVFATHIKLCGRARTPLRTSSRARETTNDDRGHLHCPACGTYAAFPPSPQHATRNRSPHSTKWLRRSIHICSPNTVALHMNASSRLRIIHLASRGRRAYQSIHRSAPYPLMTFLLTVSLARLVSRQLDSRSSDRNLHRAAGQNTYGNPYRSATNLQGGRAE